MFPVLLREYGPVKKWWRDIVSNFYRQSSKNVTISKAVFPVLLRELFEKMTTNPHNVISGFMSTGICPYNPGAIPNSKCIASDGYLEEEGNKEQEQGLEQPSSSTSMDQPEEVPTPKKLMKFALTQVISPLERNPSTSLALSQNREKRRRVHKSYGECITEEESLVRLREQEDLRNKKKIANRKKTQDLKQVPQV